MSRMVESWRSLAAYSKVFKVIVILTLALTSLILGVSAYSILNSWSQVTGTIQLPCLKDQVEVMPDQWGVPHIYASNQHDLFAAQGYIHAQDRFWQMDFWRHTGSGRLSEMFGKSQVDTDKFLRTLGWARVAQQELLQSDSDTISILQAYADGVNAYLSNHHGSALSLEYAVLKLLNPSYQPEAWQPLHSFTSSKAIAWQMGNNLHTEIERTILLKTLTRILNKCRETIRTLALKRCYPSCYKFP